MEVKKETVFIDTSFFKGIADERDDFYEDALKIWSHLSKENSHLLTSNFILDETFTLIRLRRKIGGAVGFRDLLSESFTDLEMVRVTVEDEADAWEWFLKDWSALSFTDCTSFSVMKRLGVERVATFDKHFRQAGFKIAK